MSGGRVSRKCTCSPPTFLRRWRKGCPLRGGLRPLRFARALVRCRELRGYPPKRYAFLRRISPISESISFLKSAYVAMGALIVD